MKLEYQAYFLIHSCQMYAYALWNYKNILLWG